MVTIPLNVRSGISAPVVTSIPDKWDSQWFRRFITNYLQNADIRNTPGIVGATFANPPTAAVIATAVAEFTATTAGTVPASGGVPTDVLHADGSWAPALTAPIPNNTVLGNVSGATGPPVALTETQLTTLVNVFTSTASGATPASGSGTAVDFLNAVGTFVVPPAFTVTAPGYVPAPTAVSGRFLSDSGAWVAVAVPTHANPSAHVGPTVVNGTAATFMSSDSAPAIDLAAAYTWSGIHTFNARPSMAAGLTVSGASFVSRGISDSATTTALALAATGALSITAPTTGNNALTVNGATSAISLVIVSGLSGTTSGADTNIRRAGSTANQIQQGASLDLSDSTATTASSIQHSGGQFELWMTQNNGATWSQVFKVTTVNGIVVNAPTSGSGIIANGANGSYAVQVLGNNTSGGSNGLFVAAGTTAADNAFRVQNEAQSVNYVIIRGDGSLFLGPSGSNFQIASTGATSIASASSGDTLTLGPSPTSGALIATSASLTNGAGVSAGTLTNAPAIGNPTKWIKINDNGTIRSIPAW